MDTVELEWISLTSSTLIREVFMVIPSLEFGFHPPQWHCNFYPMSKSNEKPQLEAARTEQSECSKMDAVLLQAKENESKRNWLQFKNCPTQSRERQSTRGRWVKACKHWEMETRAKLLKCRFVNADRSVLLPVWWTWCKIMKIQRQNKN